MRKLRNNWSLTDRFLSSKLEKIDEPQRPNTSENQDFTKFLYRERLEILKFKLYAARVVLLAKGSVKFGLEFIRLLNYASARCFGGNTGEQAS